MSVFVHLLALSAPWLHSRVTYTSWCGPAPINALVLFGLLWGLIHDLAHFFVFGLSRGFFFWWVVSLSSFYRPFFFSKSCNFIIIISWSFAFFPLILFLLNFLLNLFFLYFLHSFFLFLGTKEKFRRRKIPLSLLFFCWICFREKNKRGGLKF